MKKFLTSSLVYNHLTVLLLAVLLVLILAGCGTQKKRENTLTVAAAANLKAAFTEIGAEFEAKHNIPVTFVFGSTGELAQQIENGAPVDVFAAADEQTVKKLAEKKNIINESVTEYARGSIVLVSGKASPKKVEQPEDLLDARIKKIAIANPQYAPYGMAAKETLTTAGLWDKLQDKIVFGKNIQDTLTLIKTGNADAGFSALSLVKDSELNYHLIDPKMHHPIVQAMGIVSTSKNLAAAQQFLEFVSSPVSQAVLNKYGYLPPGEKRE